MSSNPSMQAPDLQEKAIQGLRKHTWGCQVWAAQGVASHRVGACGQEGHWDLWAGLRKVTGRFL